MRVYKSKWFVRFARKENIPDSILCDVMSDAECGRLDANYGGGLIKQRIARINEGKSGGYRVVLFFHKAKRTFFVYGFAKNDLDNIDKSDERDFKEIAKVLFQLPDEHLERLVKDGKYVEVICHASH